MNRRSPTTNVIIASLLFLLVVLGMTWVNYRFSVQNPGGNDFLARWVPANMWLMDGLSPYDPRVSLETQNRIYGHPADPSIGEDINHFVYPMYSMLFFGPFGLMDYLIARTLWMTVLEISLIALVFISLRLVNWKVSPLKLAFLILFSLLWYHGTRTLIVGQFSAINAVLMLIGLLLIMRGQDVSAGFFLALSTIKPQMTFLFVPFVVIWAVSVRRFRLAGSTVGWFLGLVVSSMVLIPDWPLQMLRQILEYPSYTAIGSPLTIIADFVPGIADTVSPILHVVFTLYLLVEWALAWGKDEKWFLWTSFLTLVITNLVAFRTATTHYIVLLPALFIVFKVWEQRWKTSGAAAVWSTLIVMFFGIWALFLATVEGNQESALVYLPLPFFLLFSLWWVRWWVIRPQRLMLENFAEMMQ